jgi:hypothetical protein
MSQFKDMHMHLNAWLYMYKLFIFTNHANLFTCTHKNKRAKNEHNPHNII